MLQFQELLRSENANISILSINMDMPEFRFLAEKNWKEIYDYILENSNPNQTNYVFIDEVQNAPELFSYIQQIVDDSDITGHYLLSGSQNMLLLEKITQSLAGRVYIQELLPLSYSEINQLHDLSIEDLLVNGAYPRLYDKSIGPNDFYPSYIKTYVERDVRSIVNVQELNSFRKFMRLLAHQAGQLFNASEIAKKLQQNSKTIQRWLSVLETSYIAFTL
jgi:predicted AAA+ superfamily ATPase